MKLTGARIDGGSLTMRSRLPGSAGARSLCASVISIFLAAAALAGPTDADAILGQWQGTSTCTNREVAPSCKDETTRYTFSRVEGKLHCAADKLVNGEFVSMGDLDFDYVAADRRWTCELKGAHSIWSFSVDGDRLSGTLVDVPTGKQTRTVSAARKK